MEHLGRDGIVTLKLVIDEVWEDLSEPGQEQMVGCCENDNKHSG